MRAGSAPLYLFLLWSHARPEEDRILRDIAAHFTIVDLVEVVWSRDETFAHSLSRMYGDDLPPNSAKEVHCGTGPFLVVLVEDPHPRFRLRRTNRGVRLLNSAVFDARLRYREWTGGGHRVHASVSVAETRRNLALIFGRRFEDFDRHRFRLGESVRRVDADLVGTNGWDSWAELRIALEAHGGRLARRTSSSEHATVVARDVWWAKLITGGREIRPEVLEVTVGGMPAQLAFRSTPTGRASEAVEGARRRLVRLRRRG